jgi:hypothetical protein
MGSLIALDAQGSERDGVFYPVVVIAHYWIKKSELAVRHHPV